MNLNFIRHKYCSIHCRRNWIINSDVEIFCLTLVKWQKLIELKLAREVFGLKFGSSFSSTKILETKFFFSLFRSISRFKIFLCFGLRKGFTRQIIFNYFTLILKFFWLWEIKILILVWNFKKSLWNIGSIKL